ncbi:MAG: hypothetical protein R3F11_17520 [Verrucomicrobiales bacterium]
MPLELNRELYQRWARPWASYVRDQWAARHPGRRWDSPARTGATATLYLNGIYWGIYNACELPTTAPITSAANRTTTTRW